MRLRMASSIWTRDELLGLIGEWKAAYRAAATGKSYSIGGRSLTRQDLSDIRAQLSYLESELARLDGTGGRKRAFFRMDRCAGWRAQ